ncbi:uncharacterized protein LOC111705120 [Eurytemora carolleeae]|uniref:uncharacterized protein LOC111705120 n=1 Tax=Eurytemora carolleeae TaxID=1294199 RepID=UPI000C760425|nr:uncharacterized protein LOC111705120 [Eurytemora carolleeae]|eukprot:XP_023333346.1 uncharacterized protein LOC111705120 [Eurytemora affinis]
MMHDLIEPSHHNCLTGCASTYNAARRGSRPLNLLHPTIREEDGVENEEQGNGDTEESRKYAGERRRSSFCLAKLAPPPPDPIEGNYKLLDSQNYQEYLKEIGTGPLSTLMVMRANVRIAIAQELDKRWKISVETSIKAKSVNGYSTFSTKVTENKFKVGEPTPELVEDWDQRFIVSTLSREEGRLQLEQVAEKDQENSLLFDISSKI